MKKKNVFPFIFLSLFLFGGLFYYKAYDKRIVKEKEEARIIVQKNQQIVTTKGSLYQDILALMDDAGYLVKGVQETDLEQLQKSLEELTIESQALIDQYQLERNLIRPMNDAQEMLQMIQHKFEIQTDINQLFSDTKKQALSGSSFDAQLPLRTDLTTEAIEKIQQAFDECFTASESNWQQLIAATLKTIHEQVALIDKANELLAESTRDEEDQALLTTLIHKIKSPETKASYLAKEQTGPSSSDQTSLFDKDGKELSLQPPES